MSFATLRRLAHFVLHKKGMSNKTSLGQYTENNKNIVKPTLGKPIKMHNITKEEIERIRNEFLEEASLHEATNSVEAR